MTETVRACSGWRACLNPLLAQRRREKREALLVATEGVLAQILQQANRARETGRSIRHTHQCAGQTLTDAGGGAAI